MGVARAGGCGLIAAAIAILVLVVLIVVGFWPNEADELLLRVATILATAGCVALAIRPPEALAGPLGRGGFALAAAGTVSVLLSLGDPVPPIGLPALPLGFGLVVVALVRAGRNRVGFALGTGMLGFLAGWVTLSGLITVVAAVWTAVGIIGLGLLPFREDGAPTTA